MTPTVYKRVFRLFLCRSHAPTRVCQHEFANSSLPCEGRLRQRSERLQNISFITFVYCVFETLYNNYKTMIMNWSLAYSLWEKVEVNFEHYTDNRQFTSWYNHKQKSQFFFVFYSSPYDFVMNVDCKIFVSHAVSYFSRSQAKMRILKFCLSLKRPFNNLHLKIARHKIHIRFALGNWLYKPYSQWDQFASFNFNFLSDWKS